MNKVILSGRLTKDIEVRYTQTTNKPVISNSIAVRNDFKNKDGEYDSEFINIQIWNNQAEYISKYASKGDKVLVEGRLTTRTYDRQDGTKGYVTEVVVSSIELLSSKKIEKTESVEESKEENDPFAEFGETVTIDDNFLD